MNKLKCNDLKKNQHKKMHEMYTFASIFIKNTRFFFLYYGEFFTPFRMMVVKILHPGSGTHHREPRLGGRVLPDRRIQHCLGCGVGIPGLRFTRRPPQVRAGLAVMERIYVA